MMAEDWKDCANNDAEMRKAIGKAKISDCIANMIITLHTVAVFFYGIDIILADIDVADRTIEIPHIYKLEIPFDITTQVAYKLMLSIELIQLIMSSWGMGVINVLLLTLVSCMRSQQKGMQCYREFGHDMMRQHLVLPSAQSEIAFREIPFLLSLD